MRTLIQRGSIGRVHDGAMHLLLDLDPSSDPVSGRVGLVGITPQTFTGYANLIATLESIRAGSLEVAAGPEEPVR